MQTGRGGDLAGSSNCSVANEEYFSEWSAGDNGDEYESMSDD